MDNIGTVKQGCPNLDKLSPIYGPVLQNNCSDNGITVFVFSFFLFLLSSLQSQFCLCLSGEGKHRQVHCRSEGPGQKHSGSGFSIGLCRCLVFILNEPFPHEHASLAVSSKVYIPVLNKRFGYSLNAFSVLFV